MCINTSPQTCELQLTCFKLNPSGGTALPRSAVSIYLSNWEPSYIKACLQYAGVCVQRMLPPLALCSNSCWSTAVMQLIHQCARVGEMFVSGTISASALWGCLQSKKVVVGSCLPLFKVHLSFVFFFFYVPLKAKPPEAPWSHSLSLGDTGR